MSATDLEADEAQAYFQAIETAFVRLRGAPLLLSPTDWQIARRWFEQGVPLALVEKVLDEVFARRRERGAKGRISSLRYCAPAVEHAWEEIASLTAAGRTAAVEPIDIGARLAALAEALPAELPDREAWAARIAALEGSSEEVEQRLAEIDAAILDRLESSLDEAGRQEAERAFRASLAKLAARLPKAELDHARAQLLRQHLRRVDRLPLLSLFAPEAEPARRSE